MVKHKSSQNIWREQEDALNKIQLTFDLNESVDRQVRLDAVAKGDSPSNIIRQLLGLTSKPPIRSRVGISLNQDDILALSKRLKVDPDDNRALKRRLLAQIENHYVKQSSKRN